MHPTLDGSPVAFGDHVHDVLYGAGVVVQLQPQGRFRVNYPHYAGNPTVTYDSMGNNYKVGARTVYWHNPIVTVPPKNANNWTLLVQIMGDVRARLNAYTGP